MSKRLDSFTSEDRGRFTGLDLHLTLLRRLLEWQDPVSLANTSLYHELGTDPSFYASLEALNGVMPKSDLVRRGWVRWMELALKAWDETLDQRPSKATFNDLSPWVARRVTPGGVPLTAILTVVQVARLGPDCARLSDLVLGLLYRILKRVPEGGDQKVVNMGRTLICRRTGCERSNDPRRDEVACRLLLQRYELDTDRLIERS